MQAATDSPSGSAALAFHALARRLGIGGFWHWWVDQLAPLVPAGTRATVKRRRTRPVLAFEGDAATLWQPAVHDGRLAMEERTRIPLTGDAAAVAQAGQAALAGLGTNGDRRVVISLPARQTLRRTIALPAALEENLRQALAYDLDRHTPFRADELYFDVAVVARDASRNEIKVDLAAVRRPIVDQALRHAASFGAQVAAVVPEGPSGAASSRLNLLAPSERASTPWWKRWQIFVPLACLAVVAAIDIVLPLWQKRSYAIALSRATDEARNLAAVSESLRTELDRLTGDYNFVLARKYQFPSGVDLVNEVTKLLPDDTWLLQMEIKSVPRAKEPQRELLLRGESINAGRLISAFEESKVFTQAAPRSPTTKIQPGPGEIFDLAAQVRPVPTPAAQPLLATAAPNSKAAQEPSAPPLAAPAGPTAPGAPSPAAPAPAAGAAPVGVPAPGGAPVPPGAPVAGAPAASAGPAPASPPPAAVPAPEFGPLPRSANRVPAASGLAQPPAQAAPSPMGPGIAGNGGPSIPVRPAPGGTPAAGASSGPGGGGPQ